jgi:hypothetical protein
MALPPPRERASRRIEEKRELGRLARNDAVNVLTTPAIGRSFS